MLKSTMNRGSLAVKSKETGQIFAIEHEPEFSGVFRNFVNLTIIALASS